MLCYDIKVHYESPLPIGEVIVCSEDNDNKKKSEQGIEEQLQKLNAGVYAQTSEDDFYAVVYRADDDFLDFAVAAWPEKITVARITDKLEWAVDSIYNVVGAKAVSIAEITARKYTMMIVESDNREYLKRSTRRTIRDLELNYFDSSFFKVNELLAPHEKLNKKDALGKAKELMADASLYEEIDRIYAVGNSRKFYGYPVQQYGDGRFEVIIPHGRNDLQEKKGNAFPKWLKIVLISLGAFIFSLALFLGGYLLRHYEVFEIPGFLIKSQENQEQVYNNSRSYVETAVPSDTTFCADTQLTKIAE